MKNAYQKDEELLGDITRTRETGGSKIWWLGQSGFLVVTPEATILFDPYLVEPEKLIPFDNKSTNAA